jgi:GNAT superfamily N-acetyltransferase
MIQFILRKAFIEDIDFIFRLRLLTMKDDFERTFGWNDDEQYKRAADEIEQAQMIILGNDPVGVVKILTKDSEFHLHQMQILPEHQGKGIGTAIVSDLLQRAGQLNLPVTLFVLKGSRAKNLYDRMGFSVIEETAGNFKMSRCPDGVAA